MLLSESVMGVSELFANLRKLKPFRRSFPAAKKKGCNARHNTPQNDHSFPDKSCGKYEMGAAPKGDSSPTSAASLTPIPPWVSAKRRKLCQRPRKKPIPQWKNSRRKWPAAQSV